MIEKEIKQYLDNFFTKDELCVMKKNYYNNYAFDDTSFFDPEYTKLVNFYKKIVGLKESSNYRIEVDKSGSVLIEKLFKTYVSDSTFVITTVEENSNIGKVTEKCRPEAIHKICVGKEEHLQEDATINSILDKYKNSGCNEIFVFLPGVAPGFSYILSQSFLNKLKYTLLVNNIPHVFVLDDCQGILYTDHSYEIFDAILVTAHVLWLGFDMGILFTKLKEKLGYFNKTGLKNFYEKLQILDKHKNKAVEFNVLMNKYFNPLYDANFKKLELTAPQYFVIQMTDMKIPRPFIDELYENYFIRFNETTTATSWFRIRFHEALILSSDVFLQGLDRSKRILKLVKRYNDLSRDIPIIGVTEATKSFNYDKAFDILNGFYNYKNEQIIGYTKENLTHIMQDYLSYRNR